MKAGGRIECQGQEGTPWVDGNSLCFNLGVFTQEQTQVNILQASHLRTMHFTLCKMHLIYRKKERGKEEREGKGREKGRKEGSKHFPV